MKEVHQNAHYFDGLAQDCGNSSVLAKELPQFQITCVSLMFIQMP